MNDSPKELLRAATTSKTAGPACKNYRLAPASRPKTNPRGRVA